MFFASFLQGGESLISMFAWAKNLTRMAPNSRKLLADYVSLAMAKRSTQLWHLRLLSLAAADGSLAS